MQVRDILLAAALGAMLPMAAQAEEAFTATADGAVLVHRESGVKFPRQIAGFERVGERAFDSQGEYVGVAYRTALADGSPVSLRIAIVHIEDMTPKEHYVIIKPVMLRGLADVKPVSEGAYNRPQKGADGYLGMFEAKDQGTPVGIALWTFDRGDWDLRGRVEFPLGRQAETQAAVDAFIDAFVALEQPYRKPSRD